MSKSAKEYILGKLRDSIAHNHILESHSPHYEGAIRMGEDLLEAYKENQANNKGLVVESSKKDLATCINAILQENQSQQVLYNLDVEVDIKQLSGATFRAYTQSVDETRSELFSIDTSIVQARCAIADLGIIALSSNTNAPRLSSLITNVCIYLLDKNNIVPHLFAGIEFVKAYEKKRTGSEVLPSNIIFVAGPSRTADIELQTVFGVHGPRKTYVILY